MPHSLASALARSSSQVCALGQLHHQDKGREIHVNAYHCVFTARQHKVATKLIPNVTKTDLY